MILLSSTAGLPDRRAAAHTSLRPLADSLAADLEPLHPGALYFPTEKALLSREGGRCARDGSLLEFDPFQRHDHRCPVCGTVYRGELHDRFWIYWYQMWLAERGVHAAVLHALGIGDRFGALAAAILEGYLERYGSYPNVDNVLGPTRVFFSTYLESIWLLQICMAVDLLDATHPALTHRVRDRIVEPSRSIIAEYDEGGSNRQVWNAAALLAAARLLGDGDGAERAVLGPSGIVSHLSNGLLADGTWYEGENYHLFAHRGLWYGVTMAERAGFTLPGALADRFQRGFATPFVTALPDFTLPSRRDSQYAISLRQWRIAEHCELGLARREDPALLGALDRLYGDDVPRRDTGRRTSSADVERNAKPSSLTRADLSWRALLCAWPTLPPLEPAAPASALLDAQGIAVFRRDQGRAYVALDYGHSGGGHGHPDRLNLLLAVGETRWLDDLGTGSYVDPSLHWYRSTLAHNAPLFDGASQRRVNGSLIAYDERGAAGWIMATARNLAPNADATRAIVVMPTYVIDETSWSSSEAKTVDLPLHADIQLDRGANKLESSTMSGGDGLEDGYQFLRAAARQRVPGGTTAHGSADSPDDALQIWANSDREVEWWRATSLGPPGSGERTFRILRATGPTGRHRLVMAWSSEVADVEFGAEIRVMLADGTAHVHRRTDHGWQIELHAAHARSSIDLAGWIETAIEPSPPANTSARPPLIVPSDGLLVELGEPHYRRSEQTWLDAGRPSATVEFRPGADAFRVTIDVAASDLTFVEPDAVNHYDNEPAHINGDGVQLYFRIERGLVGCLLVPRRDSSEVMILPIGGWAPPHALRAMWHRTVRGYRVSVELSAAPDAIDVLINELPRDRLRRRGQLVLSGGGGEFVYLRGDRHEAEKLLPLRVLK